MIHRIYGRTARQTFSLFLVLCLLLVPFHSIVQAIPAVTPSLAVEVDNASHAPGDAIEVRVALDPGVDEILGYETSLSYDSNVLELVSSEERSVTDKAAALTFTTDTTTTGKIDLSAKYFGDNYFISNKQEVFIVHFKIKETAGSLETEVQIESGRYTQEGDNWSDFAMLVPATVTVTPPVPDSVKIGIGTASGIPGETVEIPVSILESSGLTAAYGMQIDYDPSSLIVEKITETSGDYFYSLQNDIEGRLKVGWADAEGGDHAVKDGDNLFKISFKIKDEAATGDIPISVSNQDDPAYLTFTNAQLSEMKKTVVEGKITVNAALTNAEAPTLISEPVDQAVSINETVTLQVDAIGSGTVSYQWYQCQDAFHTGATALQGETESSLVVPTSELGTTYYYVVATNYDPSKTGVNSSSKNSRVAQVVVNDLSNAPAPFIISESNDQEVSVGDSVYLSVQASGTGVLSYQWYENTMNSIVGGTPLSGATLDSYTLFTEEPGTKYYYVTVTNTDDRQSGNTISTVTSRAIKVTVASLEDKDPAPSIKLYGDTQLYLLKGQPFIEPGYSATDFEGQDITESVIVTRTDVESAFGSYQIKYNVTDSENRSAPEQTRIVHVVSNYLSALKAGTNALSPSFSPLEDEYTFKVSNEVSTLPVSATLEDGSATFTINGQVVSSGVEKQVELKVGKNIITVIVTSQGGFTKTYTLSVTREAAASTNPGNSGGTNSGGSMSTGNSSQSTPVPTTPTTPVTEDTDSTVPSTNNNDIFRPEVVKADSNVVSNIKSMVQKYTIDPKVTSSLTDIKGHWGEKTLTVFSKLGVLKGYKDGTSKPNNSITRGEFAALIDRIFVVSPGTKVEHLSDLNGYWGADNIQKLTSAGVLKGYGDGTFKPNSTISRQEMVVILSRVVNMSVVKSSTSNVEFKDINVSYAANEIQKAAEIGIIEGKGEGVFDPKGKASRTEALQVILNTLTLHSEIKELLESL